MECDAFHDYCKAENSDDEEANNALQSQLYSEIYYSPIDVDTKTNVKSETDVSNDDLYNNAISKTFDSEDIFTNSSKLSQSNDYVNNVALPEEDSKPDITSVCLTTEPNSSTNIDNKLDLNESCLSDKKVEILENNITICHNAEDCRTNSECHKNQTIEKNVYVQSGERTNVEIKPFEQEIKETIAKTVETSSVTHQSSIVHTSDNKQCQDVEHNETYDNIFRKYEFSKSFINKLYVEKYKMLEARLEEESLAESERAKANEENYQQKKKEFDEYKRKQSEEYENKQYSKYEILDKATKLKKTFNWSDEIIIVSESDDDSEESILEVPISPKPQPPIINLNDSDNEFGDNNKGQESSFVLEDEYNLSGNSIIDASDSDENSRTSSILNSANDISITENIILNCTEVQKGASSINEIREINKIVCLEEPNRLNNFIKDKVDFGFQVPFDRDKSESVNFAEDVMVSNFEEENEKDVEKTVTNRRKRTHEIDSEPSTSAEQVEYVGSESKHSKMSSKQEGNKESWAKYFFQPMSKSLKAFYNEPRGQENFDVKEVQSKMSKDPRLWTILDEDLKPGLSSSARRRYWNKRCTKCQQHGHLQFNCPEPDKPLVCRICGDLGHMGARCTKKMCLTCGRKQGTFRKTCESCRTFYCDNCSAIGHKSTECPDLWRRFHQTTQTTRINVPDNLSEVMKPVNLLYCCNCAKRGHEASMCKEYRWSQHFPTPAFVSNYMDESQNCNYVNNAEDVILLEKSSPAKKKKTKGMETSFCDLDPSCVLYSYGAFTDKNNGQEEIRKLAKANVTLSHMTSLLQGSASPTFLNELKQMIQFEIKIFYDFNKALSLRVRTIAGCANPLGVLFIFWLKLNEEDKLNMHVNIPRNRDKLVTFLTDLFEQAQKEIIKDPLALLSQIKNIKRSISNTQEPSHKSSLLEVLAYAQENLLKWYNLNCTRLIKIQLKCCIRKFNKQKSKYSYIFLYMYAASLCTQILLRRTLTDAELQCLRSKYLVLKRRERNTERLKLERESKEKEISKSLKKKPREKYTEKLRSFKTLTKQAIASTSSSEALKDVRRQNQSMSPNKQAITSISSSDALKHISGQCIPTPSFSSIHFEKNLETNTEPDVRVASCNAEDVSNKTPTIQNNLIEIPVHSTAECTQVLSTQSYIASDTKATHTGEETSCSNNCNLSSVSLVNISPDKQSQKKRRNEHSTDIDSLEDNTKKICKKAKKAKLDESSSKNTENEAIDPCLVAKANQVINEALDFNTPYMNKAVEEIRKKISDKNLKQEHIFTLQRLVTLENDHRKYASEFCNFLQ